MKKTEKNNFEKIKEKIGKETGYIIKNLNSKNAKKELEKFIYTMACCYNDCWMSMSYLDEIETERTSSIRSVSKTEIAFKAISILENIFQFEENQYAEALCGIIKLAINNTQIFKILKEDLPSLEEIREIIKNNKTKAFDFEPIYENLIFFYLNYDYDENINEFIEKLNEALKEIVDDKEIIDKCFQLEEGEERYE